MKTLPKKVISNKLLFICLLLVPVLFILSLVGTSFFGLADNSAYYKDQGKLGNSFTIISQKQSWDAAQITLLANHPVTNIFISNLDNLGVILIPFNTNNRSINDRIIFSLKETGSQNWLIQNTYNTNQIQTNIPFPFGFPVIKNSKNKSFTFQIESLNGIKGNSISLNHTNLYFIKEYKFSKEEFIKNPFTFIQFLYYKTLNYIPLINTNELFFIFAITFLPFIIILLYVFNIWLQRKNNKYIHF